MAQEGDTAVVPIGELVVQGTRAVATTGGASALEVRLDSLRIKAALLFRPGTVVTSVPYHLERRGPKQVTGAREPAG